MRKKSPRWLMVAALLVCLGLLPAVILLTPALSHSAKKKAKRKAPVGVVITPTKSYPDPAWRKKATALKPAMTRLQTGCTVRFPATDFRFLTTLETSVGGIGLWPNPVKTATPNRYLGVFARLQLPPPSTARAFGDTENGRLLTVFDAFGKDIVAMMSRELAAIEDPQIEGAALIFVYGKRPITDPEFESDAEGLLIFIPRDPLSAFAALRMSIFDMFAQSDRPRIFRGTEDLAYLRQKVLKP